MVVEAQAGTAKRVTGGSFLIEDLTPEDIFTLEDLSPEQKQIADVAFKFAEEKISPQMHEIEAKNWDVSRKLMRDLGGLGLLGIDVPEQYGGLDMDKITSTVVSQNLSASGSFSVTFSAHVDFTPCVVWNTRAEGEVSSQAGERGMDRGVRLIRIFRRLRRNEHSHASHPYIRRNALCAQWRKDVDLKCRHGQPVYHLRQDRRREVFRFSGGGGYSGADRGGGGT
jgi:hypothetical protein